jgi:hypothetical protein
MQRINNITIGADPEMFLFSEKDNKYVPVCGLVGGTKDKPLPITDNGHSLQEDNCMIEYTIPPCKTKQEFIDNITFVKDYINETTLKHLGLKSVCLASVEFSPEQLESEQAQVFGCDPDYNAWNYEQNVVDRTKINPNLRSAGGHIHVGYDNPDCDLSIEIVRAMDLFVGVMSVLIDPNTKRRALYGKAGAYRFKKYGVEYRVLSSALFNDNDLLTFVYDYTMKAIDFINNNGIITDPERIQNCINNSDESLAMQILDDYNIDIPEYLNDYINTDNIDDDFIPMEGHFEDENDQEFPW